MSKHENITGIVSWLAGVAIGLMVVMFPLGYFIISYGNMIGSLETEAEINARIISQIIGADPEMWQFEHVRNPEYLSRRPKKGQAEIRRVIGPNNEVIAESADALPAPRIVRSVGLFDSGRRCRQDRDRPVLRPLLMQTLLLLLSFSRWAPSYSRSCAFCRSGPYAGAKRPFGTSGTRPAVPRRRGGDADRSRCRPAGHHDQPEGMRDPRVRRGPDRSEELVRPFCPERTREEAKAVFQLLKTTRQERPAVSESPGPDRAQQ